MRCKTCHCTLHDATVPRCPQCNADFGFEAGIPWELELTDFTSDLSRCKSCHYSLNNLTEPRCPECGQAFDPADHNTYEFSASADFERHTRFFGLFSDPLKLPVTIVVAMLCGAAISSLKRQPSTLSLAFVGNSLMLGALAFLPVLWTYEFIDGFAQWWRDRNDDDEQRSADLH